MGAPVGNKNAVNKGLFKDAIRRVLARGDYAALERIAEKLVSMAETGDLPAIREFADRIDGKPTQVIAGDEDSPLFQAVLVKLTKSDEQPRG